MKSSSYLILFFLFAFCMCDDPEAVFPGAKDHFNSNEFVEEFITTYDNVSVIKTLEEGTEKNEKEEIQTYSIESDLEIFIEADISKPSFIGKYSVDSIYTEEGELLSLRYEALSKRLRTRAMIVYFHNNMVHKLEIIRRFNSVISSIDQHGTLEVGKGYQINSKVTDKINKRTIEILLGVEFILEGD